MEGDHSFSASVSPLFYWKIKHAKPSADCEPRTSRTGFWTYSRVSSSDGLEISPPSKGWTVKKYVQSMASDDLIILEIIIRFFIKYFANKHKDLGKNVASSQQQVYWRRQIFDISLDPTVTGVWSPTFLTHVGVFDLYLHGLAGFQCFYRINMPMRNRSPDHGAHGIKYCIILINHLHNLSLVWV